MKKLLLVFVATGLVAACSEGPAKDAVRRLLTDPESARFSDLSPGKNNGDICGFVNAKNRMGGYVGDTPFFYEKATGATALVNSVEDKDFRSLWWSIKAENFSEDFDKVSYQCRLIDRWDSVCKTPYPFAKHRFCPVIQGDGGALYTKLKEEFDK